MAHDHGRFLSSNVSKIIDDTLTAREQEAFVLSHHFQITESATIKTPSTLEKSEHELAMIDYSNIELQKIRAKFGLDAYTVTHNQVEVYGGSQLGSATNGNAILGHADMLRQRTLLVKDENQTEDERMALIMHELVHAHAYGAVEVWKDVRGARHVAVARRGLCVRNRKQNSTSSDTSYLNTLNEAVTEELSNRILYDIPVDHPEFGEMITRRKKIIQDISKDQPRYFDRYRRPHWIPAFREEVENNQKSLRAKTAYTDEKCLMYFMFKKIYEHDPSRFKGGGQEEADEEMFSILTKAAFTGNILPFGRLFSETFGNGKFREFGHLQTVEEQKEFIEKL